jgi:hypothetical protein
MRVLFALLAVSSVAHAGNEPQLAAATNLLRHTEGDTEARALSDAKRAFGLDPALPSERPNEVNDIAVLPGCRRFSEAERSHVQSEVERWLATHEPKTGLLEIHPGCWLNGRGVIGVSWVIDPDGTEDRRSAIFRVGERGLVLVERSEDNVHHTVLTSAGDLDGDGTLDFAYLRVAYSKQYIAIKLDDVTADAAELPWDYNHGFVQPTFFAIDGRRGITVAQDPNWPVLQNGYAPTVSASALQSWRLERGKFVRDPDLDRRLTAATASIRDRARAASWLRCAAECPMTRPTERQKREPCWVEHAPEIRQSIAILGDGAGLRDAFAIIQASRDTCFPPKR